MRPILLAAALALAAAPAPAERARLALWTAELERDGPGLLLRDILRGDPAAEGAADRIAALRPDVILLAGFDWDLEGRALAAFQALLAARGAPMPHAFAPPSNRGLPSGADLDADGRLGGPGDAQGWARFTGAGAMALLSRHPIDAGAAVDLSDLLWRDLPGTMATDPGVLSPEALAVQRLSSGGHWDVPVRLPGGHLRVLAWHATPPVFDGPEDRNGRRGADEARLWSLYLSGELPGHAPPAAPFVLMGAANLDPLDGDGRGDAIAALLARPDLTDPAPSWPGPLPAPEAADLAHRGDPAFDTADWPGARPGAAGNLRVDYVLPSAGLAVLGAGLDWPEGWPGAEPVEGASRHAIVWVDVDLP